MSTVMSTVMSTEMSTHTICVNRDASRDVNKDASRDVNRDVSRDVNKDANRDASRDVNRDASRDVNLMPVVILAEMSSVIPAYNTVHCLSAIVMFGLPFRAPDVINETLFVRRARADPALQCSSTSCSSRDQCHKHWFIRTAVVIRTTS